MIELLAAIGSLGTTGALVVITVLSFKLVSSKDAQIKIDDTLDKEREETRVVRGQLALEEAAHDATRKELAEEKDLRARAEAERNEAWRQAREDAVQRIEALDPAAAAALGNHILSAPLPGVRLSDTADGHLERP